jgi:hypothetical protein
VVTTPMLLGNPSIPTAQLGAPSYASNCLDVLLNGQNLQASVCSSCGQIPLSLANGSLIVMGLGLISPAAPSYILDWQSRRGTSFYFINAGTIDCQLALSAPGTINSPSGTASTFTVAPNERGTIFKYGPNQWAVVVQ